MANGYINVALIAFFVTLMIAVFFYFRPRFINEGFTTIAIDGVSAPKCFLRDAEAQELIAMFRPVHQMAPSSEPAMALKELTLILQKALCIDADVTGSGMGPYSTYELPYATAHDIEPAASFVGRCIRNAVRPRDIEVAMGKFEDRGTELLQTLAGATQSSFDAAHKKFRNVIMRATRNISDVCLKPKNSLDTPAGPRDPGFYEPPQLQELRPYQIVGGGKQWI